MLVRARLVRLATADGLVEFQAGVAIGTVYTIDMRTKREVWLHNVDVGVVHQKVIVDANNGRWLPLECLEILQ